MKPVLNQPAKPGITSPAERRLWLVLAVVWAGMQIYLYNSLGVKIVYDSRHFIGSAELFIQGKRGLFGYRSSYGFYALLISFFLQLNSLKALIGFQVLLSGLATIAFYATVKKISGNYWAAFCAVFVWVTWAELQRWNFYVLTESVFLSLSLLLVYVLTTMRHYWQWMVIPVLLLMLSLTRPNGFLLIPVTLLALTVKFGRFHKRLGFGLLTGSLLLLPLWFWLADYLLKNMGGQVIIWQYPLGYIIQGYQDLVVTPEMPLTIPQETSPLKGLWQVVRQDWVYFFKVSALKLFYYLSMVRPYYSTGHNWFNALLILFVYAWAIRGWVKLKTASWLKAFAAAFWLLQMGIIMLLAPDWDNRFLAPSLPLCLIFSGIGLGLWLKSRFYWR
ncbi:hypothetical protein [Adhaeribacter soli]|uniref:Glycosyltransferase family 39 protein n=1 Tax=Adhaeribacter soli TaxID=2607655 RepID=A0A5N1IJB1_9BACT|nr:hypothetical protein [Adhaeribacter soli]KAA9325488.1 hypothetical protein F0P94_18060 [Adhaeribacter soli]